MSAFGPKRTSLSCTAHADITLTSKCPLMTRANIAQCPLIAPPLPWRETDDLPRIEHRREPPEAGDMQRRDSSGQAVKGQRQRTKSEARKVPAAPASAPSRSMGTARMLPH